MRATASSACRCSRIAVTTTAGFRLRAAVSCSAPQRVTTEYFHALNELSRLHNLPFYVHILETKVQRMFGEECLGACVVARSEVHLCEPEGVLVVIWQDPLLVNDASSQLQGRLTSQSEQLVSYEDC